MRHGNDTGAALLPHLPEPFVTQLTRRHFNGDVFFSGHTPGVKMDGMQRYFPLRAQPADERLIPVGFFAPEVEITVCSFAIVA